MWNYTQKVVDHFTNPRNVGEIPDANAIGEVGSVACGDALRLFLKVDPKTEVILDAKFKTFGCASAIASSSVLTEIIKGKTLTEALNVTNDDIARFLGGLPEQKMHCSVMGREALEAAVANYRGEKLVEVAHDESPVICRCFAITEGKIRRTIKENNLTTVDQVMNYTKAGGACGGCKPAIQDIINEILGERKLADKAHAAAAGGPKKRLTNLQRIGLIQKVIEEDISPILQNDRGDIELIDVDGTRVYVKLRGACHACPSATVTLKHMVEAKLRELVDAEIEVLEVR